MKTIVLAVVYLLACGCHSETADGPVAARQSSPRAATPEVVFKIIATDRGFEAPARMSAGLRHLAFENRGSKIHEAMLVKLPDGMTADGYVSAVKGGKLFPEGASDYSGAGLTDPGESVEIWVRADPGQYIVISWNGKDATTLPVHSFAVVADGAADDRAPQEDVVLKLVDFGFELEGTLKQGSQVIRVETPGPSMHEVDIFRLDDHKTVADLNAWRKQADAEKSPALDAPAKALGGLLDSHDIHRIAWIRRTFSPGRYAFHCEMPMEGTNAKTGNIQLTHADVGMLKEFEIAP